MAKETKKYDEDYLNALIAKAKKSWESVDVDSFMSDLRDDSFDKEVAEELSKEVTSYITEQIKSKINTVTIKCRDLMYGDWCRNGHGYPMQITNVGDDYAYATFEGLEGDPWEFDDKDNIPVPIPITREFLEKNGFEWKESAYDHDFDFALLWLKEKRTYIELRNFNKTIAIWFDYIMPNDGVYADIVFPVKYVHELQHALRLCGLNELANNFKI